MKLVARIAMGALLVLALLGCGGKSKPTIEMALSQQSDGLRVDVTTTGFEVGKDGHLHLRLDGGPETMVYKSNYTFPNVEPGKHSVFVELSNVAHKPLGVSQTKEIEIK